eukprot:TRINITY_DN9430_c0_g1_i1.p1 TRINITY_DN9430_c0_g1~~TRINITY_DN9430_c0_g1_i1.p1  ORF type:complete len:223 (+),score=53.00 TRINITY_DN9430_c0_g1_i1:85-753(+)
MAATPVFDAKIVVLGDTGVGKTSMSLRYVQDLFPDTTNPTVGASFLTKRIVIDDTKMKLQIWDTAGQERFRTLAPMYYRGACAAILVYDITCEESFVKVQDWIQELRANVTTPLVLALVGNKVDLESQREIPSDDAQTYANEIGALFFESSARTCQGIEPLFFGVAKKVNELRKTSAAVPVKKVAPTTAVTNPADSAERFNRDPRRETTNAVVDSGWCCNLL